MKESGRAGRPKVVTEQEMEDLKKKGWMISYRGLKQASHTDAFKHGDFFAGSGLFGNGIYVQKEGGFLGIGGKSRQKAIDHIRGYGEHVMRIAIPPDAKVVSLSKVEAEQKKYRQELCDQRMAGKLSQKEYEAHMDIAADVGRFAALRNYDAVYCTIGGYYNVINRSILAVQDKNI